MSEIIGVHGCLTFMSGGCILGLIFVIFVMEETNGRDLDAIGTNRPVTSASDSNNNV